MSVVQVSDVSPVTRADILARARGCIGRGFYSWGRGGLNPNAEFPWGSSQEQYCDCSGFVAWCMHESRQNAGIDGGWIQTGAMVHDATGPQRMFLKIDIPAPGDIIVYGERHVYEGTSEAAVRPGHTGVISQVTSGTPFRAIHCAKGNMKRFTYAIAETNVSGFIASGAICIRPRKVAS